jgi:hypothetical protein
MGLKKSGVKKGNSKLQRSGLFGIIDKVTSTNRAENTAVGFPASLDHQARKSVMASVLKAESDKARAIKLIRRMSIR